MKITEGKFEELNHTVYGGETMTVPVFVNRENGLTVESNALLYAASILGSKLIEHDDVDSLFEKFALQLSDEDSAGVIVEDDLGKGAINIRPNMTTVSVRNVGKWELSTSLFFEMGHAWAELDRS